MKLWRVWDSKPPHATKSAVRALSDSAIHHALNSACDVQSHMFDAIFSLLFSAPPSSSSSTFLPLASWSWSLSPPCTASQTRSETLSTASSHSLTWRLAAAPPSSARCSPACPGSGLCRSRGRSCTFTACSSRARWTWTSTADWWGASRGCSARETLTHKWTTSSSRWPTSSRQCFPPSRNECVCECLVVKKSLEKQVWKQCYARSNIFALHPLLYLRFAHQNLETLIPYSRELRAKS